MLGTPPLFFFITVIKICYGFNEDQHKGPVFISEPPSKVEFLNTTGASVQCIAHGIPEPIVEWVTKDNNIPVTNVPNIREILPNNTLVFYPFGPTSYLPEVHAATYKCAVTNIGGSIVSREVHVRAAVKQNYESKVHDEPVIRGNTGVLKCYIPNVIEEFISVTSWIRDDTITIISDYNEIGRYSVLPSGELHIRNVGPEDDEARFQCRTKHRLTGQTKLSSTYGAIQLTDPRNSVAPAMSDKKITISVTVGKMAELSCAAQGFPIPEYTWFIKSPVGKLIKMPPSRKILISGGLLRFTDPVVSDSNSYECVVNNSLGMERREMDLLVTEPLNVNVEPKHQVVDVGKPCSLKCNVGGFPIESVTWIKDMQPLYVDGRRIKLVSREELYITSVQREDKGMYQCFAYNGIESAQGSSQLILGDAAPVLLETFEERLLQPGPSISLKCVASGSPLPEIKWTLDGVELPKNDRLQVGDFISARNGDVRSHVNISNVRADDGGYYQCTAKNKIGIVQYGARLNVYGVPYIREMKNRSVLSGRIFKIQCPVAGYPIETISWQRGGKTLPENHAQKVFLNGTLMVHNIQPGADEGQYTCIASNKQGQSARKTVDVKVAVPPMIDDMSFPRKLRLVESRRMSIHCTVVLGDLPISVEWQKDGKPIGTQLGLTIRNFESESTLMIRSVDLKHNGTYTCIARNPAATVSRTAVVIVDIPPSWVTKPEDISVALGSTAFLHCMAEGSPAPQISWKQAIDRDFKILYNMYPFEISNNGTLAVRNMTEDLGGKYLCQASNGIGKSISKVINIDVRIPAYFILKTRNQTVRKEDDTILHCEGFGDPPITIVWNKDSLPIGTRLLKRFNVKERKTEKGSISELHVKRTERNDTATFTCQIRNNFGTDEMTINLVVLEPPEPAVGISAKVIGSREVEIAWKHSFDGNSPITKYIIQYKNHSRGWDSSQVGYQTLQGSTTRVMLNKLRPASKYDARLITENEEGTSVPSKEVSFNTQEDNPEAPPQNVAINAIGTRSVKLSWMPPKELYWNGDLQGYHCGYKQLGNSKSYRSKQISIKENATLDEVAFTITGLRKNTKYEVIVQAYNSAGSGPNSTPLFFTTLAESVGKYPPNRPSLKAVSIKHTSITLSWTLSVSEDRPVKEYVLIYSWGKVHRKMRRLKDQSLNSVIVENLKCGTQYSFNITAFNKIGQGKPSNVIDISTNGSIPVPADKEAFVSANKTFIALDMTSWDDGGCPFQYLAIKYKRRGSAIWTGAINESNPNNDIFYVKNLRARTKYIIHVITENDAGVAPKKYNVQTTGMGLRSSAADLFSGDMTFVLSAVGLIVLIVVVLVIVSICLCVRRKKPPAADKNKVRKAVNGNNNNKKKVELPDVPGPVKKNSNHHHHQQNNRSHSPQQQNAVTYENTSNLIYCPENEELMPYAKMVLGAKMEDADEGSNGQVEFKTFYMKAGARRTDPPPLPPRDDSLATKIATLRRNPRPPGSHRYHGNGSEETGDESDIYREPEDSELPPPPITSLSRLHNNPSNKQNHNHGSLNHKAQNHLNMDRENVPRSENSPIQMNDLSSNSSPYYSNTPPAFGSSAGCQTGVYTNFPPPPIGELDKSAANNYYSNSSIIAQHQANMLGNPQYQMVGKMQSRKFPMNIGTNSFRRASEDVTKLPTMKNPPPPSQLRASSSTLNSDASELENESRDHIATRLHKEILGARNSNKIPIPQSIV